MCPLSATSAGADANPWSRGPRTRMLREGELIAVDEQGTSPKPWGSWPTWETVAGRGAGREERVRSMLESDLPLSDNDESTLEAPSRAETPRSRAVLTTTGRSETQAPSCAVNLPGAKVDGP